MPPDQRAYPSKDIDVLFSGTYTDYRQVQDSILNLPDFLTEMTENLIALMLEDSSLTQEDALTALLPSLDEIVAENFALHMQACFLCDTYLRAFKREQILLHLADADIPLTLCGNGWKNSPLHDFSQVRIIDDTPFFDTFSLFRRAKITLNIMPEFKNGTHDRIYSAMLNHSLCFTDATPVLCSQFLDKKDLFFYPVQNCSSLTQQISELLSSPARLETVAQSGYQSAKENHTWQSRVVCFLDIIN